MRQLHLLILPALLAALPAAAGAAGPLTFDEAEKAMLQANPAAAAAARGLEAAGLRVNIARAGFYPLVSGNAAYTLSGSQGDPSGDSYSFGVGASQPLFRPSLSAALSSAEAAVRSAQASYKGITSGLRYQLKAAFAEILNARETIKLSQETMKRRAENLELLRLKYQAGRENKAALLETEAALKTAQWQHQKYLNALRMQERTLNRLLGRAPRDPAPDLELPAPPAPPEDMAAFSERLARHYSLLASRASVASARASVESARSSAQPEATASGAYSWSGTDLPSAANGWSLGASLSVPIFAWGKFSTAVDASRAQLASAEYSLNDATAEVYLNAEDAFLAWREAYAYLDAAKSSLDAAEARAWLVRKQYLAGQSSYFEWRSVEEQLITEQNQYLTAGRALALAHAAFIKAIGE